MSEGRHPHSLKVPYNDTIQRDELFLWIKQHLPEYTAPSSLPTTKLLTSLCGNARHVTAIALLCLCWSSKVSWGCDNISKDHEHSLPSVETEIKLCAFCVPTTLKQYTGCWNMNTHFISMGEQIWIHSFTVQLNFVMILLKWLRKCIMEQFFNREVWKLILSESCFYSPMNFLFFFTSVSSSLIWNNL